MAALVLIFGIIIFGVFIGMYIRLGRIEDTLIRIEKLFETKR